jgi:pyruvate dehydrogenase E2 component (dihydrolipoamide acetyltransferase)
MAIVQIVMPQMGESITTGTIVKWTKKAGDSIELDEVLLEISTDKVNSEIPSPVKGRVEKLFYKEGDTIDVGKVIADIEDDLSKPFAGGATTSSAAVKTEEKKVETKKEEIKKTVNEEILHDDKRFYTPLVKAMAKDAGVSLSELATIKGTGSAGRVNREDFENYLKNRGGARPAAQASQAPRTQPSGRVEIIPMDNMRKAIAKNMVASKMTSPHVNSISEVDMTHLMKFRESFKAQFEKQEGFKLTITPFIMKAIVDALRDFPYVNASIEGDNIVLKKDINLGFAVAVPGNGLIVPVIKSADTLSMVGLCRAMNDLINKAKAKKLSMADLSDGTFTFTNNGFYGVLMATPIILQPQVGIYATGMIQKRVVVNEDDSFAVRQMMYGCHTYDHRLIDGEMGAKFLHTIHTNLAKMNPKDLF